MLKPILGLLKFIASNKPFCCNFALVLKMGMDYKVFLKNFKNCLQARLPHLYQFFNIVIIHGFWAINCQVGM